jgi:hypothetical protein
MRLLTGRVLWLLRKIEGIAREGPNDRTHGSSSWLGFRKTISPLRRFHHKKAAFSSRTPLREPN